MLINSDRNTASFFIYQLWDQLYKVLAPRGYGSRDEEVGLFAAVLLFLNYNGIPIFQTPLEKQTGLLVNYPDVRKMGVKITVCYWSGEVRFGSNFRRFREMRLCLSCDK